MNLLSELQYFPPIIFYKNSFEYSNIVFEQYEFYQKMSFRNRMLIAGAHGIISLSIPLEEGRDQKKLIRDIKIDNRQPWQKQHWRSIISCYNHSPWFEYYREDLSDLYETSFEFLLDWNLACFDWTAKILAWPVGVSFTESYVEEYDSAQWLDLRNKILPKNYKNFEPTRYRQVFEERTGFFPNLSILDLLCCEGKRAGYFLQ